MIGTRAVLRRQRAINDLLKGYDTDSTVRSERIGIGSLTAEVKAGVVEKTNTIVGTLNVLTNNDTDCVRAIASASMDMSLKELQACYNANKDSYTEYRKPTKKAEFVALLSGNWETGKRKPKKESARQSTPQQTIVVEDGVHLSFREAQAYIKKNGLKRDGFKATSWAGIKAIIEAQTNHE
jgi:hypothetical protein